MPAITSTEIQMRQRMETVIPNTHGAITYLVPALEDAYNSIGKRTLFGKDKFAATYHGCLEKIKRVLLAMEQDGLCGPGIGERETETEFFKVMGFFADAYPNWPNAYEFFGTAFYDNRDEHLRPLIRKFVSSRNAQNTDKWQKLLVNALDEQNQINKPKHEKSSQSFDASTLDGLEPELSKLMTIKLNTFPILLQDVSLIQKTDAQFLEVYASLKNTHSLEQIVDEAFLRTFPPNGIPKSEKSQEELHQMDQSTTNYEPKVTEAEEEKRKETSFRIKKTFDARKR